MFKFFRINDPYRLLISALMLIGVRLVYALIGIPLSQMEFRWLLLGERLGDGVFMYREVYDYTAPLASLFYYALDIMIGRSVVGFRIVSSILLILIAAIFNEMLIKNKAYGENNYIPSFVFLLLACALPDHMVLSPHMMSLIFIMLALKNVFRRIDNIVTDDLFLYAGLYVGIATLFYVPSVLFFFYLLFLLLLFSTSIPRRLFLYLYGFVLPLLVAIAYFYWQDSLDYFQVSVFGRYFNGNPVNYTSGSLFFIGLLPLLFWSFAAIFLINFKGRYNSNESRIIQAFYLMILTVVACLWIDIELSPAQFVLTLPPAAFFISHYALLIQHRFLKLLVPVSIVISCLIFPYFIYQYNPYQTFLFKPKQLPIEGKPICVFSDDLGYYGQNRIGGPAIDSFLSQIFLSHTNDYRKALHIYLAIEKGKPAVIIDDWQVVVPLFERFPLLAKKYRKGSTNKYYRISVSN